MNGEEGWREQRWRFKRVSAFARMLGRCLFTLAAHWSTAWLWRRTDCGRRHPRENNLSLDSSCPISLLTVRSEPDDLHWSSMALSETPLATNHPILFAVLPASSCPILLVLILINVILLLLHGANSARGLETVTERHLREEKNAENLSGRELDASAQREEKQLHGEAAIGALAGARITDSERRARTTSGATHLPVNLSVVFHADPRGDRERGGQSRAWTSIKITSHVPVRAACTASRPLLATPTAALTCLRRMARTIR